MLVYLLRYSIMLLTLTAMKTNLGHPAAVLQYTLHLTNLKEGNT
jgi:hypothetical protein